MMLDACIVTQKIFTRMHTGGVNVLTYISLDWCVVTIQAG